MKKIDMKAYGLTDAWGELAKEYEGKTIGRIIAQEKGIYRVVCEGGAHFAETSGKFYHETDTVSDFPAVGDFVMLSPGHGGGRAIIHQVLDRKSVFIRKAAGKTRDEQVVAANIDTVFICMALDNDFSPHRLERYMTICWESGAFPVVVLTKADLCENLGDYLSAAEDAAIGADIVVVSAMEADGYRRILPYIEKGRTIALVGSSGVGKSTLIGSLLKGNLRTNAVREDGKGRHTTTRRELFLLPEGGLIIDTPGMREVGLWEISEGFEKSFADVTAFLGKCKFGDCSHTSEPGCAIRAALDSGELSKERWESYLRLNSEAEYAADRDGYLRKKTQFYKQISLQNKSGDKRSGNVDYNLTPKNE